MFRNIVIFYGEGLLAPRPTPKLENHPLLAVCDFLFNVFAATLHIWRPFLHPQPKDVPCHGDRDPLIMGHHIEGQKLQICLIKPTLVSLIYCSTNHVLLVKQCKFTSSAIVHRVIRSNKVADCFNILYILRLLLFVHRRLFPQLHWATLRTRREMVLEMLVYLPFYHMMRC
jgi:hypothetical protein